MRKVVRAILILCALLGTHSFVIGDDIAHASGNDNGYADKDARRQLDECTDTDAGAVDPYGEDCDDWYVANPSNCGGYDDDDFSSDDMCCACGGGGTQIVTPTPTLGSSVWTSPAPVSYTHLTLPTKA